MDSNFRINVLVLYHCFLKYIYIYIYILFRDVSLQAFKILFRYLFLFFHSLSHVDLKIFHRNVVSLVIS